MTSQGTTRRTELRQLQAEQEQGIRWLDEEPIPVALSEALGQVLGDHRIAHWLADDGTRISIRRRLDDYRFDMADERLLVCSGFSIPSSIFTGKRSVGTSLLLYKLIPRIQAMQTEQPART